MVDCTTILANPSVSELISACLGAQATEKAAVISASASLRAAWIQGIAALAVLAAGYLAYRGAVRQTKLAERAHDSTVAAYRIRMRQIAVNILDQTLANCIHIENDTDIIRTEHFTA